MTHTAYYRSLEGSGIRVEEDLEDLKKEWCIKMWIFETPGLTLTDLEKQFPGKPEVGTVLDWLKQNHKLVHKS